MKEHVVKTTKHIVVEGNNIKLQSATHTPERVSSTDEAVIFIPGWAMRGTSRGLENIARSFATIAQNTVHILSSNFSEPTPQSLHQEVEAMEQYLSELGVKKVTLAGHSEGARKALELAKHLEQKRHQGFPVPEVTGVIAINLIGLVKHTPRQLTAELLKAAFLHIPTETVIEIAQKRRSVRKFYEAGIIGLTMAKNIAEDTLRRGPRKYLHQVRHIRQEIQNMMTPIEPNSIEAPVVVVLGRKDNVTPIQEAIEATKATLPNATILTLGSFGHHGMPYQEYETIARESIGVLERARR